VGPARILAVFEPRSNTMKRGDMAALLPWALEEADQAFCFAANLGWDPQSALSPMGDRVQVQSDLPALVRAVARVARPGDHVLCMSNGGFGGVHGQLLAALAG
jgi:UDP-N-acetylmuramate: L-alanyl-gamma-D-glutamyl-meso-diaminopimelate ligase